jgi:hypothetical protein
LPTVLSFKTNASTSRKCLHHKIAGSVPKARTRLNSQRRRLPFDSSLSLTPSMVFQAVRRTARIVVDGSESITAWRRGRSPIGASLVPSYHALFSARRTRHSICMPLQTQQQRCNHLGSLTKMITRREATLRRLQSSHTLCVLLTCTPPFRRPTSSTGSICTRGETIRLDQPEIWIWTAGSRI